jgi:putative transposase
MSKTNTAASESLSPPLCCRYLLAVLDRLSVKVGEEGRIRDNVLHWGLGVLSDGQRELLGVWHQSAAIGTFWHAVSDDLKLRGVEKIRFVEGIYATEIEPRMGPSYLGATALPSIGSFMLQIAADLPTRDRAGACGFLADLYAAETAQGARTALDYFAARPLGAKHAALVRRWRIALEQIGPLYALVPRVRRIVRSADIAAQELNRTVSRAVGRRGCFPSLEAATSFVAETLFRAEISFGGDPAARAGYRAGRLNARSGIAALGL